jgi:hypothetical protein
VTQLRPDNHDDENGFDEEFASVRLTAEGVRADTARVMSALKETMEEFVKLRSECQRQQLEHARSVVTTTAGLQR